MTDRQIENLIIITVLILVFIGLTFVGGCEHNHVKIKELPKWSIVEKTSREYVIQVGGLSCIIPFGEHFCNNERRIKNRYVQYYSKEEDLLTYPVIKNLYAQLSNEDSLIMVSFTAERHYHLHNDHFGSENCVDDICNEIYIEKHNLMLKTIIKWWWQK